MGTGGEIEDEADEDEEGKLLFAVKVDAAQQPNRVGVNMRDRARSWRQSDHSRSSLGPCWPSALVTKGSDPFRHRASRSSQMTACFHPCALQQSLHETKKEWKWVSSG